MWLLCGGGFLVPLPTPPPQPLHASPIQSLAPSGGGGGVVGGGGGGDGRDGDGGGGDGGEGGGAKLRGILRNISLGGNGSSRLLLVELTLVTSPSTSINICNQPTCRWQICFLTLHKHLRTMVNYACKSETTSDKCTAYTLAKRGQLYQASKSQAMPTAPSQPTCNCRAPSERPSHTYTQQDMPAAGSLVLHKTGDPANLAIHPFTVEPTSSFFCLSSWVGG